MIYSCGVVRDAQVKQLARMVHKHDRGELACYVGFALRVYGYHMHVVHDGTMYANHINGPRLQGDLPYESSTAHAI